MIHLERRISLYSRFRVGPSSTLTRLTRLFVTSTYVVNNAVDNLRIGFECLQRFDGAEALQ